MEIASWLQSLGLGEYAAAFRANAIDLEILPKLSADDLKEIGVLAVGHRRKLLEAIAALNPPVAAAGATPDTGVPAAAPAATAAAGRSATPGPTDAAAAAKTAGRHALGERRQVTVLFADLTGYTQLSTEVDAEDLHTVRTTFTDMVDSIIGAHGGTVERHIGDSVMAVFGAPVARDNDPERAVHAALAIRDAMPALSQRVARAIGVHIGVASGEVVAMGAGDPDHPELTVTGETVNLAARLTGQAPSGAVLISASLQRALADKLECVSVGALEVKGFAEPMPAWRVVRVQRAPAAAQRLLVGRLAELRQLAAALTGCIETRRGQTIYFRGEAGIGKTRLVEEFQRMALASGFACHGGLVLDFGTGSGRDAVRSIVRSLLGAAPGISVDAALAQARSAIAAGLIEPERMVFLYDLLDLPPPPEQRAIYDAMDVATRARGARETVATLAAGASRKQPVLLVIEDVHWADPTTLDSISALAECAAECPVLLLMTSRQEGDPLGRGWRVGGPVLTVDLAPLRRDEALSLASQYFKTDSPFAAQCIERAAGNPLFLEQLLRHAEERAQDGVPDSVQSLVQARMDRLDAIDKQAMQAAAVFGQRFSLQGVRHLLADAGYDASVLLAHFLVRPQGEELLFSHALIRDAVYATLLRSRRRELHRLAATWFATRDAVLHAEHLDRAEDPMAVQAYLVAARSQAQQYRYEQAVALAKRGIVLAAQPAERFALTCYLGELQHDLGAMGDSLATYQGALSEAQDDASRCRAWLGLAGVKRVTDDIDGALADLTRAEELATRLGLDTEAARAHYLHGNLLFPRGDVQGCLREHQRCLELAKKTGQAELEASALGGLGDTEYLRGRMLSANDHFRRCIDLARQRGFGRIEVANRPMAAFTLYFSGEVRRGLSEALAAIEAAARVGHHRAEILGHMAAHYCNYSLREFDRAAVHIERGLLLARRIGARRFEAQALANRGDLCRLAGRRSEAVADIREALAISTQSGMSFMGAAFWGWLALATGDPAEREHALAQGEAILATDTVSHNHLLFRRQAIEVCAVQMAWDRVAQHADAIEAYCRSEPSPMMTFHVRCTRARVQHALGIRSAAQAAELDDLIVEGQRMGLLYESTPIVALRSNSSIIGAPPAPP